MTVLKYESSSELPLAAVSSRQYLLAQKLPEEERRQIITKFGRPSTQRRKIITVYAQMTTLRINNTHDKVVAVVFDSRCCNANK